MRGENENYAEKHEKAKHILNGLLPAMLDQHMAIYGTYPDRLAVAGVLMETAQKAVLYEGIESRT